MIGGTAAAAAGPSWDAGTAPAAVDARAQAAVTRYVRGRLGGQLQPLAMTAPVAEHDSAEGTGSSDPPTVVRREVLPMPLVLFGCLGRGALAPAGTHGGPVYS